MTYIVNKSINSEARKNNFLDVGIHDNVELRSIELKVSPSNNPYLVLTFVQPETGKVLTQTEYEPKDKDGNVLENKQLNQVKRLKHIATKFISEDEFVIETESFEDFCKEIIKKLKGKFEGVKVRIKAVYNDKGYVSLPKYVPFIERMDVKKSTLEILSIDKMTRETPDRVSSNTNPFKLDLNEVTESNSSASKDDENDLPF